MAINKGELLEAIVRGDLDGRSLPSHPVERIMRDGEGERNLGIVQEIEPATDGYDLAILDLAVAGMISPQKLFDVYPDVSGLRMHLVRTIDAVSRDPALDSFMRGLNLLLVSEMDVIPGWNDELSWQP